MTVVLRRAMPFLMVALALANSGCGSKSSERERTPTGPQPPASGEEGRFSAMAVAPPLGTADSFAVLAFSTVTNTGPSIINGDPLGPTPRVGVSNPPGAVTGFPPGIVTPPGTIHSADAVAMTAQTDVTTAYNNLAGQMCDVDLSGTDLGGLTLTPGVYCFSTSAQLTGELTLDGLGNPGAVWVFQIGSTLTTASGSLVTFINGGQACGAFWQVGSSATLGTTTSFSGNILALASITLNTGATSVGALFARNGAVTLDSNVVSRVGSCGSGLPPPPPTPLPGPVPALPQGAVWTLLVVLLGTGAYILSRH